MQKSRVEIGGSGYKSMAKIATLHHNKSYIPPPMGPPVRGQYSKGQGYCVRGVFIFPGPPGSRGRGWSNFRGCLTSERVTYNKRFRMWKVTLCPPPILCVFSTKIALNYQNSTKWKLINGLRMGKPPDLKVIAVSEILHLVLIIVILWQFSWKKIRIWEQNLCFGPPSFWSFKMFKTVIWYFSLTVIGIFWHFSPSVPPLLMYAHGIHAEIL